jgi:chitodextrinase
MHFIGRSTLGAAVLVVALLALAPAAPAAAPAVTTTNAQSIAPNAATLTGRVDPNGEATTYYFEYGTTRRYGSRTGDASAGRGNDPRRVTLRVEGLAPNTRYHFRIVASNPSGVRSGENRTFTTRRQPLGLQITAAPNPVVFGAASTITGALTGTGNGGRQVVLQQLPFPFTAQFADVGNPVVTDQNGAFSFPILPLPGTTQFRVRTVEPGNVFSPILTLGVAARVATQVSDRSVRRFRRVRFFGTVTPAAVGAPFEIQRRTGSGRWLVVGRGFTTRGRDTFSRFSRRVRVSRTAKYRVLVHMLGGPIVSGFGREVGVVVRRRR